WRGVVALGASAPNAEATYRIAGARLRELIWDPLLPSLGAVERALVVPDASLNLVTLAALPVGRSSYLVEQRPIIHYLGSERDLVVPASPAHGSGLLAMGGASFDSAAASAAPQERRGGLETCLTLGALRFPPLA